MIRVITPPAAEPITLEEAKAHLRVVFDDENDYISRLIVAARQMAEGRLNRTLPVQTIAASFDGWGSALKLPRPPFIAVESIAYIDSEGAEQLLEAPGYYVNEFVEPAAIYAYYGVPWPSLQQRQGAVTVTYRAGYVGGVPEPIKAWMLLAIGALYQNRESVVAGVSVTELPADFMNLLLQPYMVYE